MIIPRSTPWRSGPGLLCALRGPMAASVGRFAAREYRDSHKGAKCRDGPANGLNGGLLFLGYAPPCWTRTQNSRLEAIGGHTSGRKLRGNTGIPARSMDGSRSAGRLAARATLTAKENPPQVVPGREAVKIFSPSPR